MEKSDVEQYGWTAVPRNRSTVPGAEHCKATTLPIPIDFDKIWPQTEVVKKAEEWVKARLPEKTFNHSLRVYCYGHTILTTHLPTWPTTNPSFLETWALTCLFHDIATTASMRQSTHLSFEFQGGFTALAQLQALGAPRAQAESVCEAIIRHQDPGETGMLSRMGLLVQLATEFDNMGWQPHLIHAEVIVRVVQRFPRMKWSSCFADTIDAEIKEKPWCHTTAIPGFKEAVAGNELMEPYD